MYVNYYLWTQAILQTHTLFHCYDLSSSQDENEGGGGKDDEQSEEADRKEHNTDGLTGEENIQSDMAVELAGEASERDQTKEVCFTSFSCFIHITLDKTKERGSALNPAKVSPLETVMDRGQAVTATAL